ncbi:MAG: ATP-binding cassette domain-containing protein [Clostridia bacterium]|nr:ATP-binding cassette domain-containing protein [Clostridia bacterium]
MAERKVKKQAAANKYAALKLVDIVKTYGEGENAVNALKGINLTFRKNEFVSVLGPSGCGKTTMLNIIGGLDRYTSGDLIINGVSTKEYKDRDWDTYRNNSVGFVFQNYNLIPHQTVLSNVELALTLSGVSKAERHKKAKEVLKKVGLENQAHKKPNQLSGGQMQRVAIARALVNDPEIILADEPTGALDTETSIQIMDLLKEVARDRLVIMVTHNPTLAEKYSTRIINLLDGEKTGDTNEFTESAAANMPPADASAGKGKAAEKAGKKAKGKAAMKFGTAFGLSFSNLLTKKGRTILTAIAGSIGIIGIALVLAVSTGFSGYIKKLQADTLSVYPLTISESTIDLEDFQKLTNREITDEMLRQRVNKKVYTKAVFGNLTSMLKSNILSDEYLAYVNTYTDEQNTKAVNAGKEWAYAVQNAYGFDVNNFLYSDISVFNQKFTMPVDQLVKYLEKMFDEKLDNADLNVSSKFIRTYIPTISEIPDNRALIESQYELIDENGKWPEREDELLLVVDKYNQISDITLALLGLRSLDRINTTTTTVDFGGDATMDFDTVKQKNFYYLTNDNRYVKSEDGNWYDKTFFQGQLTEDNADLTLTITGIARLKEDVQSGVLETGIAYTSAFTERIRNDNKLIYDGEELDETNSPAVCVAASKTGKNPLKIYSWYLSTDGSGNVQPAYSDPNMAIVYSYAQSEELKTLLKEFTMVNDYNIKTLAGDDSVKKILIYSAGYEEKENLKTYLDEWNEKWDESDEEEKLKIVHYSDSTAMLFAALNSIVDAVKIVLIAFTAISLVVSSIMIGIITYVSVVERTKEIGVLRSIGARKKDISRIFNAETFLIGLFAGLLGVAVSYLLTIPINLIIGNFIENAGSIAALRVVDATILVVVSFVLTLIAGVIPSRIAAHKDPVVALRTE